MNTNLSNRLIAILMMTLASAVHYAGYELARSSVLALFTSRRGGFTNSAAAPLATGFISPFSLFLLWLYARLLKRGGPRNAIFVTTFICASVMALGGWTLGFIDPHLDDGSRLHRRLSCGILFSLLVSQNGFVQLLSMQHWSFISSVTTKEEGTVWIAPIAGIGSVASTLAAMAVSPLVDRIGLRGLLVAASLLVFLSAALSNYAHAIAQHGGFEPTRKDQKIGQKEECASRTDSLYVQAKELFRRVPVLGALCNEVILCQCFSSLMSFLFVLQVKGAIPNDDDRARWTGTCYAWINGISGFLQFIVLPFLTKHVNPTLFWILMPSVMVAFTAFLMIQLHSTLLLIGACFCTMKIMEYSLRGVANEMVYISLDYESTFIGKEIIGLFVNRLGKSGMAVTLSVVTAWHGGPMDQELALASNLVSVVWLVFSYRLSCLLRGLEKTRND